MHTYKSLAATALMLLLLAACSSSGIGDILGGGGGSNQTSYDIRGTVDSVDRNNQSIYLTNVSGYNRLAGNNDTVRIYYDNQTAVTYSGKSYRPEDLERGDEVTVRVDESGNRLLANSMTVTYDVSGGGSMTSSSTYGATVRGTVRSVDTSRHTIQLDSINWISRFDTGTGNTTGSTITVSYDPNASVDVNGRMYPVGNLERGDYVEVQLRNTSSSNYYAADRLTLLRDVNAR